MILTIGHSTHAPATFKHLMNEAGLSGIIDIRSHRTSKWPWWHAEPLQGWLDRGGFTYDWLPELGGWDVRHAHLREWAALRGVKLDAYLRGHFPKQRIGADADQQYEHRPEWESKWTSQGLHDYAWFTATNEFQHGLNLLTRSVPPEARVALVCSEAMWWKCHRSMVADALVYARGERVQHVMPSGRRVRITDHDPDPRIDRYPTEVLDAWRKAA